MHARLFFPPLISAFLACCAGAVVVNLEPIQDNTLYEDPSGSLSNGSGSYLFAGATIALTLRRALLAFDLTSIPADATINSVTLRLRVSRSASGTEVCTLHTVSQIWGEGASNSDTSMGGGGGVGAQANDATWLDRFFGNNQPWTTAGGDFDPIASASANIIGIGFYNFSSAAMAEDVARWHNGSLVNAGWMVRGNEADSGTAKRFDSSENTTPAHRPTLVVDYTPIPAPASLLLGLAALGLSAGRRRHRSGCLSRRVGSYSK